MKKIFIVISLLGLGVMLSSCNLEKFPETGYNEGNVDVPEYDDEGRAQGQGRRAGDGQKDVGQVVDRQEAGDEE